MGALPPSLGPLIMRVKHRFSDDSLVGGRIPRRFLYVGQFVVKFYDFATLPINGARVLQIQNWFQESQATADSQEF